MADILFVHDNFPGQFGQVAYALAQRGHRVKAIASDTAGTVAGVEIRKFTPQRPPTKEVFALARRVEMDLLRAYLAAREAEALREAGFNPALIVGHPGWGETMFLSDVFPRARTLIYGEHYTTADGGDVGFDAEMGPLDLNARIWGHVRNLSWTLPLLEADRIVCPTPFQASRFPRAAQDRITVVHDGVDTEVHRPRPDAEFRLDDGRVLTRGTPLITYVARKFEPLRGFHILMRALPKVLEALPSAEVLMIGQDGSGYGPPPPPEGWTAKYLAEVEGRLDLSRVHFTGKLPHDRMVSALQASSAHVYYTYPFVLSWSVLEAMACGALVVASDTAPVRDAIRHGVNGLLGDFFDHQALAERLIEVCRDPAAYEPLRTSTRATVVERYDLKEICLPAWIELAEGMLKPA